MSFTDHFNPHPKRRIDQLAPVPAVASQSAATDPDIKALLGQMAGQMAEAERRHGDAMRDMQTRLDRMAQEAQQVRSDAPAAAIDSIARIETSVAGLADRIGEVSRERQAQRAENEDQQAAAAAAAPKHEPREPFRSPPIEDAPAPLRSALNALDSALQAPLAMPAAQPAASASVARDPAEPWDQEQADALSQLYEMGAAGLAPSRPEVFFPESVKADEPREAVVVHEPAADSVRPMAAVATFVPASLLAPVAGLGDDKAWLDGKFAEIARGIERQLAETRPDSGLLAMGNRLDLLESRFTAALSGVAQRTDLAGLSEIERQIGDMAAQFERTERQLARLDVLEWQLKDMTARMTDLADQQAAAAHNQSMFAQQHADFVDQHSQSLTRQQPFAPSASEPHPQADYHAIADAAAERVAVRLASAPARADAAPARELEALIQGYISERRRGDEHTAMALDTVQEALARLIDRVDQFEVQAEPAPSAQFQPVVHANAAAPVPELQIPEAIEAPPAFGRRPAPPVLPTYDDEEAAPVRPELPPSDPSRPQANRATLNTLKDFEAAALRARAKASASGARAGINAPVEAANDPAPVVAGSARKNAFKPALMIATVCCLLFGAGFMMFTFMKPGQPMKSETRIAPAQSLPLKAALPQGQAERAAPAPLMRPTADGQPVPQERQGGRPNAAAQPASVPPAQAAKPEPLEPLLPTPSRERSVPDTVNDDLSQNATPPTAPVAAAEANRPRVPAGIAVQAPGNQVNIQELIRIQERQKQAAASSRLGAMQVGRPFAPTGAAPAIAGGQAPDAQPAQPAAQPAERPAVAPAPRLQPVSAVAVPASQTADTEPAEILEPVTRPSSGHELPPAMIGPMSLRLAAAKGDPSAEFEVAARFAEGRGVPQDYVQANTWYQRSAGRGFAPAQYRLGTLYERGMAVAKDTARARIWYKRAAEQGHVKAMHNLAVLLAGADTQTADYANAATLFTQAAERGLADSQFNLAVLYENGLGLMRDQRQAFKWYALAALGGDREAAKRRDAVRGKLDREDIKAADAAIQGFRPRSVDTQVNDPHAAGDAWRNRAEQQSQLIAPPQLVQPPQQVTQPPAKLRP